jgi:triphosphatase
MSPPREVELKLEVPANGIERLSRSSLLKGAATASRKPVILASVYFDTDKLKLRKKGLSLRVRRIGRRHVQTIKQESGESAAWFERNEWEQDVSGELPDLDAVRNTGLEPLLSKKLRRGLKPGATNHTWRALPRCHCSVTTSNGYCGTSMVMLTTINWRTCCVQYG